MTLAMALHELTTNTLKYGAVSAAGGRVNIEWGAEGTDLIVIEWTESGGPSVSTPARRGFGSELIECGLGVSSNAVRTTAESHRGRPSRSA